jgi:hypothetical protein
MWRAGEKLSLVHALGPAAEFQSVKGGGLLSGMALSSPGKP